MRKKFFTLALVSITILLISGLPIIRASNITNNLSIMQPDTKDFFQKEQVKNSLNDTIPDRPFLEVKKNLNLTLLVPNIEKKTYRVEPGQIINVNISIKNIGQKTAYNLTIFDPSFADWAISSLNMNTQRYVIVQPNATVFYYYYFVPILEGNFTLESTEVNYFHLNGTEYRSFSQRFNIYSIVEEIEEVIQGELWSKILIYCIVISGVIGLVVAGDYILVRRRRVKTKKVVKKAPAQKSKKQQKRKIQKRR
ncbi:MAG: hypothetical protein ACFFDS_04670 [Candidatus Thorarchaeota archaeon]